MLARIEAMLLQHLHRVVPGSLLGKALHYLSAQWPKLIRYVENGAWPIDNNLCENAIRPFVIGRRNWLFADTVAGANASANLYSLIETCKANRIDPYAYLVSLFRKLPAAQSPPTTSRPCCLGTWRPTADSLRRYSTPPPSSMALTIERLL